MSVRQCWLLTGTSSGMPTRAPTHGLLHVACTSDNMDFSVRIPKKRWKRARWGRCHFFVTEPQKHHFPCILLIGAVMKGSHLTHFPVILNHENGSDDHTMPKHLFVCCQEYRMTPYISWFCVFYSSFPPYFQLPIIKPWSSTQVQEKKIDMVCHLYHILFI